MFPHLGARDVALAVISHAPLKKLLKYRERMGWRFPWLSAFENSFNFDFGVSFEPGEEPQSYNYVAQPVSMDELPGFSIFYKDADGEIFHTYSCYARGLDVLNGAYHCLDLLPMGQYKSVMVTRMLWDYYDSDPARGFYGGGGIDARSLFSATPIFHAMQGMPPDTPDWGVQFKEEIAHNFTRQMSVVGSTTSLALDSNNITLDPTSTDSWGRPAIRATYRDHPDDLSMAAFLQDRAMEILDAAGAEKSWRRPIHTTNGGEHLLGTCRMGNDPETSVVDSKHRSHDIPNLFICDGSSFVTSGRGQPTMTIMALAFRAAEHIIATAKAGEI